MTPLPLFLLLLSDRLRRRVASEVFERLMPFVGQVYQNARLCSRNGEVERRSQKRKLAFNIVGFAEGVAHRHVDEETARRAHERSDIPARRNIHSRNAHHFDDTRDQTHGLVIKRSSRDGYKEINAILLKTFRECRRRFSRQTTAVISTAHKAAPVTWGDSANLTGFSQLTQTINREQTV